MKVSFFKKYLSYIWEIPVSTIESHFSGTLTISLHKGAWKLSTDNAIYSFGKYYTSYRLAFQQLQIHQRPIRTMLLLGCGIGSVASLLEKHPTLQHITAIDIDPVIIALAENYWPEKLADQTIFIDTDASEWVANAKDFYFDLIVADIFIDDQTPEAFLQPTFLSGLKRLLSPNGLLLFSKIHFTEQQKKANLSFEKTFKSTFPKGYSMSVGFNKMMVATNDSN